MVRRACCVRASCSRRWPARGSCVAGPVLAGSGGPGRVHLAIALLVAARRVLVRRPGRRGVLTPEIPWIKHGDRLAADARLPLGLLRLGGGVGAWLICGLRAAEYFSASVRCSCSVSCSRSRMGRRR